jgi:hypothetical protein
MKRRRRNTAKTKATPSTAAPNPKPHTHFFDLPGEIRNKIYEYCIDGDITVEIFTKKRINSISQWPKNWGFTTFDGRPEDKDGDVHEFALSKTCRQIRYETLPVLAKVGHTCLYVDVLGAFRAELMAPLPAAYLANIREMRLWKFVPSLRAQTLTKALPGLRSILLDFTSQALVDLVGSRGPWRRWFLETHYVHNLVKGLAGKMYKTERQNLTRSAPDRQVALKVRIPFGRFKVSVRNWLLRGARSNDLSRTQIAAEYTIVGESPRYLCLTDVHRLQWPRRPKVVNVEFASRSRQVSLSWRL